MKWEEAQTGRLDNALYCKPTGRRKKEIKNTTEKSKTFEENLILPERGV